MGGWGAHPKNGLPRAINPKRKKLNMALAAVRRGEAGRAFYGMDPGLNCCTRSHGPGVEGGKFWRQASERIQDAYLAICVSLASQFEPPRLGRVIYAILIQEHVILGPWKLCRNKMAAWVVKFCIFLLSPFALPSLY